MPAPDKLSPSAVLHAFKDKLPLHLRSRLEAHRQLKVARAESAPAWDDLVNIVRDDRNGGSMLSAAERAAISGATAWKMTPAVSVASLTSIGEVGAVNSTSPPYFLRLVLLLRYNLAPIVLSARYVPALAQVLPITRWKPATVTQLVRSTILTSVIIVLCRHVDEVLRCPRIYWIWRLLPRGNRQRRWQRFSHCCSLTLKPAIA